MYPPTAFATALLAVSGCGRLGFDTAGTALDGDAPGARDVWLTPPTKVGAPAARMAHTAVWTGSAMLVWGGSGEGYAPRSDGGRYEPAADRWTAVAAGEGAPRVGLHAAVWTGTEMLVWGGRGEDGAVVGTGARYHEATGTWTPMTTVGAPSPRQWTRAAWTGTEMIVWSGDAGVGSVYADGGRYDPVTDAWAPMSTVGAPERRNCPAMIWTGSEVVVWGGWNDADDNTWLSSGGRYDPATDTWRPTSTVGAPTPRTCATAVWTGSEMIVWGGGDGTQFDDGGRYDPITDTWGPTPSSAGAPTPRWAHAAAWTGSQMIVWGGNTEAFTELAVADGGIYVP